MFSKSFRKIESWNDWKELWDASTCLEQLLGLLHCGFGVFGHRSDQADRLCFYLDVADGHRLGPQGFAVDEKEARSFRAASRGSRSESRSELSKKAFEVMAQNFFRSTSKDDRPSWFSLALEPIVFEKLVWFFRVYDGYIYNLGYKLTKDVHWDWANEFLLGFCKLGWAIPLFPFYRVSSDFSEGALNRSFNARPDFIEMLDASGNIRLLLDRQKYPLDKACLERLREVSLRKRNVRIPVPGGGIEERVPDSIQEAIANGSNAAMVYQILDGLRAYDADFEKEVQRRQKLFDS